MKYLWSGLFILFMPHVAMAQDVSDLKEYELKGKVKSVHQTIYKAEVNNGVVVRGERISNDYDYENQMSFDSNGKKTEETRYDQEGKPKFTLKYKYDVNLSCIEEGRYNPDGSLVRKGHFKYEYNDRKLPVQKSWLNDSGSVKQTQTFSYNDSGKLSEIIFYRADGKPDWRTQNIYNEKEQVVERYEYTGDSVLDLKTVFRYDATGKMVEETLFRRGKNFIITYGYAYDAQGNKTEINWRHKNGKVYAVWRYTLDLDPSGNWIRLTELNTDKAGPFSKRDNYIVERTIAYYE